MLLVVDDVGREKYETTSLALSRLFCFPNEINFRSDQWNVKFSSSNPTRKFEAMNPKSSKFRNPIISSMGVLFWAPLNARQKQKMKNWEGKFK